MNSARASLRAAAPGDIDRVADILAGAFENDPFMTWMLPEAETRRARVRQIFKRLVLSRLARDRDCYLTEHGAAVWGPPGAWRMSTGWQVRTFPALVRTTGRRLPRAAYGTAIVERHHPTEPAHWYLEALGVRPGHQGQGIGSTLMEPMLDRCDADTVPAYLETTTERNLVFYERLGFGVREEFDLRRGPHVWTMWRDPLPVAAASARS
jgi:GNAT superfamily N-acetyltransferase